MSLIADVRTLWHLAASPIRGQTHAQRLESFYSAQAGGYDDFRRRLLHGRRELFESLPVPAGGVWVDIGGGTGANMECLGDRIHQLGSAWIVDLSTSLLTIAKKRIADRSWINVHAVEADALRFTPPAGPADIVTFSYSLTMIPDWFAALEQAWTMLKPGGLIGVVDFHVSRKYPDPGLARHGWLTRTFWPAWFAMDNVHLGPDRLAFLRWRFQTVSLRECRAKVPYMPLGRVPYFSFVGRKPA